LIIHIHPAIDGVLSIENSKTGGVTIFRARDANLSPKPFGLRFPGDDLKATSEPHAALATDFVPMSDAN